MCIARTSIIQQSVPQFFFCAFHELLRDFSRVSNELAGEISRQEMNEMHFKTPLFQKRHCPELLKSPAFEPGHLAFSDQVQ